MILPVALGFAAGCMIWMVFAELLPDALERGDNSQVATAATVAAAGLEGFRMLFASMEQADGSLGGGGAAAAAMGVLGCMAERLKQRLLESDRLVDIVAGPDAYR